MFSHSTPHNHPVYCHYLSPYLGTFHNWNSIFTSALEKPKDLEALAYVPIMWQLAGAKWQFAPCDQETAHLSVATFLVSRPHIVTPLPHPSSIWVCVFCLKFRPPSSFLNSCLFSFDTFSLSCATSAGGLCISRHFVTLRVSVAQLPWIPLLPQLTCAATS